MNAQSRQNDGRGLRIPEIKAPRHLLARGCVSRAPAEGGRAEPKMGVYYRGGAIRKDICSREDGMPAIGKAVSGLTVRSSIAFTRGAAARSPASIGNPREKHWFYE